MSEAPDAPAEMLGEFRASLAKLHEFQTRAADSLYAGDYKEGGARLKTLFEAWNDFLGAVRKVLPSLQGQGPLAQAVPAAVAGTLVYLRGVQSAIERKDWVETADLLGLGSRPLFLEWEIAFGGRELSRAD